jgi:hypothetical protein
LGGQISFQSRRRQGFDRNRARWVFVESKATLRSNDGFQLCIMGHFVREHFDSLNGSENRKSLSKGKSFVDRSRNSICSTTQPTFSISRSFIIATSKSTIRCSESNHQRSARHLPQANLPIALGVKSIFRVRCGRKTEKAVPLLPARVVLRTRIEPPSRCTTP